MTTSDCYFNDILVASHFVRFPSHSLTNVYSDKTSSSKICTAVYKHQHHLNFQPKGPNVSMYLLHLY